MWTLEAEWFRLWTYTYTYTYTHTYIYIYIYVAFHSISHMFDLWDWTHLSLTYFRCTPIPPWSVPPDQLVQPPRSPPASLCPAEWHQNLAASKTEKKNTLDLPINPQWFRIWMFFPHVPSKMSKSTEDSHWFRRSNFPFSMSKLHQKSTKALQPRPPTPPPRTPRAGHSPSASPGARWSLRNARENMGKMEPGYGKHWKTKVYFF